MARARPLAFPGVAVRDLHKGQLGLLTKGAWRTSRRMAAR